MGAKLSLSPPYRSCYVRFDRSEVASSTEQYLGARGNRELLPFRSTQDARQREATRSDEIPEAVATRSSAPRQLTGHNATDATDDWNERERAREERLLVTSV